MFVTASQLFVFLACVAFGGTAGVLLSVPIAVNTLLKNRLLKGVLDALCFAVIYLLFLKYSLTLNFPSLRVYMVAGVFLGIFAYLKSYHIILAKITKKAYNISCEKMKSYKGKLKRCRVKNKKG